MVHFITILSIKREKVVFPSSSNIFPDQLISYIVHKKKILLVLLKVDLNNLFERADIISLHAPSLPETDHMVGPAQLARMRNGAVLINTARGSLIDQEALIKEAGTGRIRVALDVTTPEPLPANSPLRTMSNVIITPHLAGQGRYGHERIGAATLQALEDFFSGKTVSGAIDHSRWEKLA